MGMVWAPRSTKTRRSAPAKKFTFRTTVSVKQTFGSNYFSKIVRVPRLGVEVHGMKIVSLPIVPPAGPCPKCGREAALTLTEFDKRGVEIKCGACGTFTTTKRHLD